MIKKNRLAAGLLAACIAVGGGVAVAAPAQAYEMYYKQIVVMKSGYSSQSTCYSSARSIERQFISGGWTGVGGDSCKYLSSTKKWGFSMVFIKRLPKES